MKTRGAAGTAPQHVVHIVFDLNGGGLESLVAAMADRYQNGAAKLSVVSLSGRVGHVGATLRSRGHTYHVLRPLPGISMAFPLGLVRCLRGLKPTVVHIHSGVWYKAALAARFAGVRRVVYTEHGREHYDPPLRRLVDRQAARLTDVVVAVSNRLEGYLERVVGVAPRRLRTIENGIDLDVFTPASGASNVRDALGIPVDAPVVGSVGRFEEVKGYDRLVSVFAAARDAGEIPPAAHLVLCGDGGQRANLEALAAGLGVSDHVHFLGWVDDTADVYRAFDVFALTSHSEGMSVSLLEAMACGVVPLVTDVGANAELMGPELRDHAIPADDMAAFGRTLSRLLADPSLRARVGPMARERVAARYNLDRVLAEYWNAYGLDN